MPKPLDEYGTHSGMNERGEWEFVYEWAQRPTERSSVKEILTWWHDFLDTAITLWRQGIGMIYELGIADILTQGTGLKTAAYKQFDLVRRTAETSKGCARYVVKSFQMIIWRQAREDEVEMLTRYYSKFDIAGMTMERLGELRVRDITHKCL